MDTVKVIKYLFNHPELKDDFEILSNNLMPESDRGAILIAAEIIESKLEILFRKASTSNASKSLLKKLLEYHMQLMSSCAANKANQADAFMFSFLHSST